MLSYTGVQASEATAKPSCTAAYEWIPRTRALMTVAILLFWTPLSFAAVACAWVLLKMRTFFSSGPQQYKGTVIVTGGKMAKSMIFVRWFWKAGYRVVLVETPKYWLVGSRFSRAVGAFYTIPCPRTDPDGYVAGLIDIAEREQADFFVPVASPAAALHDSYAKKGLEKVGCQSLHFPPEVTEILDDKDLFCNYISKTLELVAPESWRVSSNQEVLDLNQKLQGSERKFILKNITYDPVHRLDMFKMPCPKEELQMYLQSLDGTPSEISGGNPWQVQQFIQGPEYSCFAVMREGHVRAMTTCESSPSQLNYEHVCIPSIEDWVSSFAKKTGLTGQICWDFLVEDGVAYPIECNPRVHSQCVMWADQQDFGSVILDADHPKQVRLPNSSAKPRYWWFNELFKLLPDGVFYYGSQSIGSFLRRVASERDAIFDMEDPMPFLMINHFQLPLLLLGTFFQGTAWKKLDFCIGKVVELNGD